MVSIRLGDRDTESTWVFESLESRYDFIRGGRSCEMKAASQVV